jgi:hypothetical protein
MRTDVHEVTIEVTVPAGTSEEAVADMVERMLNTAQYECECLEGQGDGTDCSRLGAKADFSIRSSCYDRSEGPSCDCTVDVDEATYIGDDNDGVYYQVFEDDDGSFWMSAIVDCDPFGFVDGLVTADGPYATNQHAEAAGRNAATEWCALNEVDYS